MTEMLIHSSAQLLTLAGDPQRGTQLGALGLIEKGAVLIQDGQIVDVGTSDTLLRKYPNEKSLDVGNRVTMPGFVDAHSHPIWAGDRATEFEQRLQGKTYLEILEAGGGIISTVKATRRASKEELLTNTRLHLQRMFLHGSTTIEAKTGYGLDFETELRLLQVLLELDAEGPWELAFTYLAAHAIPPEFKARAEEYVDELCRQWLPATKAWWEKNAAGRTLPFVDVFCETDAFDLSQSRRILVTAKGLGFPLKIHSDEFNHLGGTGMAVQLGAASADHLVNTGATEITALANSDTVAVALPATPFGLTDTHQMPAKAFLHAGGLLAIGSDLNPGTAWCENLQFAIALACRSLKLTPAQAIAATTINGATAIQRQNEVGSIEVGKQADLLILDANDYRHLGYRFGTNLVHTVIKKGTPYPVAALLHVDT